MIVTVASFKGGVGKTTSAVHIAAYFQKRAATMLVDGDLNRSATKWAKRGSFPFQVIDERQGIRRHVLGQHAARCDIGVVADADRRDER